MRPTSNTNSTNSGTAAAAKSPGSFSEFAAFVSEKTSTHGSHWYSTLPANTWTQRFFFGFFFTIQILLFSIFAQKIFFSDQRELRTSMSYEKMKEVFYPHITVCASMPFSWKALKDLSISSNLATYLLAAKNPYAISSKEIVDMQLHQLDEDYRKLVKNTSLENLFEKITIRCEDLIRCKVVAGYDEASCCGSLFDSKPHLSISGLCFTSQKIRSQNPNFLSYDWIQLGVVLNQSSLSALNVSLLSDDFIDFGVKVSLHYEDHGAVASEVDSNVLSPGTQTIIKIKLENVEMETASFVEDLQNRIKDSQPDCIDESSDLFRTLVEAGFENWSENNCFFFFFNKFLGSCQFVRLGKPGAQNDDSKPLCEPRDVISALMNEAHFNASLDKTFELIFEKCRPSCSQTNIAKEVTVSPLSYGSYQNMSGVAEMQLKMSTNRKVVYKITSKSLLETLADVGGWLGLVLGASIVSLGELIYFCFIFTRISLNKMSTRFTQRSKVHHTVNH